VKEVAPRIVAQLGKLLGLDLRPADRRELDGLLQAQVEQPLAAASTLG